jgi:hypothetical protein
MEVKEDIPGICNKNGVYALIPSFKGQEEAVCPVPEEEILKRLNAEVTFLKDNPGYNDKGMINLIINCRGELVYCRMDNKTQSPDLDKQIEAVFSTLGEWKAGKLKRKQSTLLNYLVLLLSMVFSLLIKIKRGKNLYRPLYLFY